VCAGVTATVSSTGLPARTVDGTAAPAPLNTVETAPVCGVTLTSSIARPSSEPDASASIQRIQNLCPVATLSPVMVPVTMARLAGSLPLSAPVVAVFGEENASPLTGVQLPSVSDV